MQEIRSEARTIKPIDQSTLLNNRDSTDSSQSSVKKRDKKFNEKRPIIRMPSK